MLAIYIVLTDTCLYPGPGFWVDVSCFDIKLLPVVHASLSSDVETPVVTHERLLHCVDGVTGLLWGLSP